MRKGRQDEISYFIISSQRVVDFRGSVDLSVMAEPRPHPKDHYIHPSPSISSPSGTGREDPPCDWARAKAQQGGVKPAGMFHIHSQRE